MCMVPKSIANSSAMNGATVSPLQLPPGKKAILSRGMRRSVAPTASAGVIGPSPSYRGTAAAGATGMGG